MNAFGFYYRPYYHDDYRTENYMVVSGDSLYKIARKYNVNVEDLIKENNLNDTLIYPGQAIVIPNKMINGSVYFEEYVVGSGDDSVNGAYGESIELIAKGFNIPVEDITNYNDITKLMLVPNQTLKIPLQYKKLEVYATDDVNSFLKRAGITAMELLEANQSEWLKPGTFVNVK